jgi:hypothetical protein
MWLALLTLLGLLAATAICLFSHPNVFRYLLLLAASVAWFLTDGPVEGEILLRLTSTHGLTLADLAAVAAWAMVAADRIWPGWASGNGRTSR